MSSQNRQVQRFDAAFHMPEVSAIDTLTQDWSQHNNYANPPWDLSDAASGTKDQRVSTLADG